MYKYSIVTFDKWIKCFICLFFLFYFFALMNLVTGNNCFQGLICKICEHATFSFSFSTAEAVLQKMDHMKKMRRRRMRELEDLGVFNDTEEVKSFLFRS